MKHGEGAAVVRDPPEARPTHPEAARQGLSRRGVRRSSLAILLAAALPCVVQADGALHTVTIEGLQFSPAQLTVHRGERIVWVNKDPFPHTVTADGKQFDSHSIAANASWTYVAAKPGEYPYSCTFHPSMKGQLKVQ